MRKSLAMVVLSGLGLAGCVAVPMIEGPVAYVPPPVAYGPRVVYAAPAPVVVMQPVVRPFVSGGIVIRAGRHDRGRRHL